jgi:ribonuclease D
MTENQSLRYTIVNTKSQLAAVANRLQKQKIIGVDLEADSLYHFKEKVCLIQIAAEDINIVIDPFQIKDLSALKPLFKDRDIQKIFHGAMDETSLEAVLKRWFNVSLNKKYQRKDWSKRPLPEEMIAYAAEDARYLVPLAQRLVAKLKQKNRLAWLVEECEHLSNVRPTANDTQPLFLHFKGAGELDPRSLAILEALLQFRKQIARKKDKPLFKIIQNNSLLNLAIEKPQSLEHIETTAALSPNQINMYGQHIINTIRTAMKLPSGTWPKYPRKKAPVVRPDVGKRVKAIRDWRNRRAKMLKIDPALLFTNALISAIAVQNPIDIKALSKINDMKRWQKKEFGKDVIHILSKVR